MKLSVEDLCDQFKNKNSFVADDNFTGPDLFIKFASSFYKTVEALLDDIINATETQLSNKNENERRNFFINKSIMLEYFKNFMHSVLLVFRKYLSFIEKILPASKLSRKEIINRVENWNDNYEDLSYLLENARSGLNKTKENASNILMADMLTKLAEHTDYIFKYFCSDLLEKISV